MNTRTGSCFIEHQHRGTSLTRKRNPLRVELYRRHVPRVLWGSLGGFIFLWARHACTLSCDEVTPDVLPVLCTDYLQVYLAHKKMPTSLGSSQGPTTPQCWRGVIHSKQAPVPVSTFENHCLEGKLTFGDPCLDSVVAGISLQCIVVAPGGPVPYLRGSRVRGAALTLEGCPHTCILCSVRTPGVPRP